MNSEQESQDFRLDMAQAILEGQKVMVFGDNTYCVECHRSKGVRRVILETKQKNTFNCPWCMTLKTMMR